MPSTALVIAGAIVFGTIALSLLSVRNVKMDPAQYIVAGRSFGTLFLWVLLAGEIYTTFTFLGVAGLAYSTGAPAFYAMCFGGCGYVIGYFLSPAMWRVGKEHNLLTGPDFFENRYNSRALGVACAVLYFLMVVPYVTLQLSGLQILLRIAGYGNYDATLSVCVAFIVLAFFVFTAGLRGTAWASVVKDVLVLGAVLFAGIAIPMRFFGSPAAMFDRLAEVHPQMMTLPVGTMPHGTVWFVTSVLVSTIGFFMGPHTISATFSARSGDTLRRNAMLLPFYQTALALMLIAGLSATLITPGLKGTHVDQSFLLVVQRYYPGWILGLITAAGALAALVPASSLLLAGASVITKNVAGDVLNFATSDRARTLLTRVCVLVVALLALVVWLFAQKTVVELLLLYYNGIVQFAPAAFATFIWKRATAWGVAAGIGVGLAVAMPLAVLNVAPWGINVGLLGVGTNAAVLIAVSLLTSRRESA